MNSKLQSLVNMLIFCVVIAVIIIVNATIDLN